MPNQSSKSYSQKKTPKKNIVSKRIIFSEQEKKRKKKKTVRNIWIRNVRRRKNSPGKAAT